MHAHTLGKASTGSCSCSCGLRLTPPLPPPFLLQVEAFDLLVPGMGEIVGGSAREERLGPLLRSLYKSPGEIIDPNAASSQLQPGWEDSVNNSALKW